MRILLVTLNEVLPVILSEILNSDLEYCAIVVDEPKATKKIVVGAGLSKDLVYPSYELKECLENFYYDCCVCITDRQTIYLIPDKLRLYNLPNEKFVHLFDLTGDYNFQVKKNYSDIKNIQMNLRFFRQTPWRSLLACMRRISTKDC